MRLLDLTPIKNTEEEKYDVCPRCGLSAARRSPLVEDGSNAETNFTSFRTITGKKKSVQKGRLLFILVLRFV